MRLSAVVLAGALATCFAGPALAQDSGTAFGIMGGVNFSKLRGDVDEVDFKTGTGFSGGFLVRMPVSDTFAVEPEILYTSRSSDLDLGVEELNVGFKADYIEIPVLLAFRFGSGDGFRPKIFFGPSVAFRLSAKAKASAGGSSADEDIKDLTNGTDFGLVGGFGGDIGSFSVDLRYTYGLTQFADESDAADLKWSQFGIYAGFIF